MRLIIHDVFSGAHPNLRAVGPEDAEVFDHVVVVRIGFRPGKGADEFVLRVATPAALAASTAEVIAQSPLLVLQRFDYEVLWAWLERTVEDCRADTWALSVERLRRHFSWEFAFAEEH